MLKNLFQTKVKRTPNINGVSGKKICLFSSYFIGNKIPTYVRFYLCELKNFFDEVYLITNNDKNLEEENFSFLNKNQIKLKLVKNEGYDFGMWCKALQDINTRVYKEIALVNDSCILFRRLDSIFEWAAKQDSLYLGLVDSREGGQLHIQSYFLIFKNEAITFLQEYFKIKGLILDYSQVIKEYEIGLYGFLFKKGIKGVAKYPSNQYQKSGLNPLFFSYERLLGDGFPLVKKKMLFHTLSKGDENFLRRNGYSYDPVKLFSLIKYNLVNNSWSEKFSQIFYETFEAKSPV